MKFSSISRSPKSPVQTFQLFNIFTIEDVEVNIPAPHSRKVFEDLGDGGKG